MMKYVYRGEKNEGVGSISIFIFILIIEYRLSFWMNLLYLRTF